MYNEYIKKYEEYINNPIDSIKNLGYFIQENKISYKHLYDLEKIYKKLKNNFCNYVKLKSNGSTKCSHVMYKWGPNFRIICDLIWNYMHRFYNVQNKLYLRIYNINSYINDKEIQAEGKVFYINTHNNLKNFYYLNNVCYICTPMTLHELLRYDNFIDLIKNTASVISTTETDNKYFDFNILKELGIPYVNQMRSWKEGTAFYTCPYGNMHWMENLFYCTEDRKIIDLFNFYNTWWNEKDGNPDNIYPLENEFHLCECGSYYRKFNFEPCMITCLYNHKGELIDFTDKLIILKDIIKKHDYLQIIQQEDLETFNIHIDNNDHIDEIKKFIKQQVFQKKYNFNIYYEKHCIGHRCKNFTIYSLYKSSNNVEIEKKFEKI